MKHLSFCGNPRICNRLALVGLLSVLMAGCSSSDRGQIEGSVTLDGQPVTDGTINFIPASGTAASGNIESGHYSIADLGPSLGTNRVEIRWTRKTGKKYRAPPPFEEGPEIDETIEAIPTRYNTESELKAEVKAGKNTFDYQLTSKGAKPAK